MSRIGARESGSAASGKEELVWCGPGEYEVAVGLVDYERDVSAAGEGGEGREEAWGIYRSCLRVP